MLALRATPFVLAAVVGACLDGQPAPGPRLSVGIAPLELIGPDNVCYDLLVENGTGTVWSRGDRLLTRLGADQTGGNTAGAPDLDTVCSDRYGNSSGGAVTYIGTCDAASDSDTTRTGVQNRVTLWVDGLYESGADIGAWQDPCPNGCSLSVDCEANEDSLVEFNLTIMRQANQGFFDIAVNFQDIFCSAKFDTCYPDGADDDSADDPITLIHGADQTRDWTGVLGLACTAGSDATATRLLYGPIAVTCGANVFVIDPTVGQGNASVAGSTGGLLHYSVYRGTEQLDCGSGAGSCKKLFWNVALSIQDLESLGGSCSLALTATATDDNEGFTLGLPTAVGVSYPYIDVNTPLTTDGVGVCMRHPLNVTGSAVQTRYRGNIDGIPTPTPMCHQFDGVTAEDTGATEGCVADDPAPICVNGLHLDGSPCTGFVQAWGGGAHTCGVGANGGLYCWGDNSFGQLGLGSNVGVLSPTRVGSATDWTQVSTGEGHSCGLRGGMLFCWGNAGNGQVGDGTFTNQTVPTRIGTASDWTAVSASEYHTCGIRSGEAYCWGFNGAGQLGTVGPDEAAPIRVGISNQWTAIDTGMESTCGILGGALYCWGSGLNGQLGADNVDVNIPPVQIGLATDWTHIAMGQATVCGIRAGGLYCWGNNVQGTVGVGEPLFDVDTGLGVLHFEPVRLGTSSTWSSVSLAIHSACAIDAGALYCWGSNGFGQLGLGTVAPGLTPTQVGTDTDWTSVSVGGGYSMAKAHGCGIKAGVLRCWGDNSLGQLGTGTSVVFPSPMQVGEDIGWTGIAAMVRSTCGLRNGAISCWGDNGFGQLGSGTLDLQTSPAQVGASSTWDSLSGSGNHACALNGGELFCWGANTYGQLGDGTTDSLATPTRVGLEQDWQDVSASSDSTCGIRDGDLYCWGGNSNGQLGDGTFDSLAVPTRIGVETGWTDVESGRYHTCGIKAGELYCWGANWAGQLGDGTTDGRVTPTRIGLATNWSSIAVGQDHTCGIAGGLLYCWGPNYHGELGVGSTDPHLVPTQVTAPASGWTDVTAGQVHTCGISAGALYCWGLNQDAQVGDGTTQQRNSPTRVGLETGWSAVRGNQMHTCGVKGGELFCWGKNTTYALGIGDTWSPGPGVFGP